MSFCWHMLLENSKNKKVDVPYQVGIRKLSDCFIHIFRCSFDLFEFDPINNKCASNLKAIVHLRIAIALIIKQLHILMYFISCLRISRPPEYKLTDTSILLSKVVLMLTNSSSSLYRQKEFFFFKKTS